MNKVSLISSKKYFANWDYLKYLMSIFIILLHAGYSSDFILTRVAVPVFFILSSYFFFNKIQGKDNREIKTIYSKFLKRSVSLYLFWFVVLFPTTYLLRHWYDLTSIEFILVLIKGVFLSSTFPASWYISAYVIGISLALLFRKHKYVFIMISVLSYVLCCLESNYGRFLLDFAPNGGGGWYLLEYKVYNSFPAGLLYICIGSHLASMDLDKLNKSCKLLSILFLLSLGLLGVENWFIQKLGCSIANDCYFSLAILSPILVLFVYSLPIQNINNIIPIYMRKMSTIYYCTHFTILEILKFINNHISRSSSFLLTFLICTFVSVLLISLSQIKGWKILKYSY